MQKEDYMEVYQWVGEQLDKAAAYVHGPDFVFEKNKPLKEQFDSLALQELSIEFEINLTDTENFKFTLTAALWERLFKSLVYDDFGSPTELISLVTAYVLLYGEGLSFHPTPYVQIEMNTEEGTNTMYDKKMPMSGIMPYLLSLQIQMAESDCDKVTSFQISLVP